MNIVSNSSAFANGSTVAIATSNDLSTLVVFDGRLEDLATLYGALLPGVAGFTIDPAADALVEITRLLAETGAKSLSIVAHGEPGVVHIGAQPLDLAQINRRSGLLQEWCVNEIALYSCEVGVSKEFIAELGILTGATVAASATKVGSVLLGGDWQLINESAPITQTFNPELVVAYASTLAVVGYYNMIAGQGVASQVPPIVTAGQTAVLLTDLTAADLTGIDVLFVNHEGGNYGSEYLSRLAVINDAVANGLTLVINDRFVNDAESILPGVSGNPIVQDFSNDDIQLATTNPVFVNGPGGAITNTNLDTGTSSSHGYALLSGLPAGSIPLLTRTDSNQVVAFSYEYGSGHVVYSTVPLDYYLDDPNYIPAFSQIYAPNIIAYAVALDSPVLSPVAAPTAATEAVNAVAQDIPAITGILTVQDPNSGNILTASVVGSPIIKLDGNTITTGFPTGLTADGTFTLGSAITANGAAQTIDYTYDPGAVNIDFLAVGQALTVTYQVKVNDGTNNSAIQNVTFTIIGTNDAPVPSISAVVSNSIAEDTLSLAGDTVGSLFSAAFADADNSFFGIAITGNTSLPDQGTWEWLDGTEWTEITGVATTGALVLDKNTLIRFSPAADYNGTPGALTARLIDSSTTLVSGTGGHAVNGAVGVNSGGATAISRSAVTLTTSVTAVNDAPTLTVNLSPAANAQNYTEGGATSNGLFVNAQANTHILGNNTEAEQKFQSVTLEVSNLFAGDQLRIDGALVNIDTTTTSIVAGTFAVDVTVADGISQVTISRPGLDISNANLQTVIEGIGFNSTSDNPTDFGNKNTRDIKIVNIKDNGGIPDADSTALSLLGTITIHDVNDVAALTDDSGAATEGSMPINATGNVLSNDIDLDNTLYVSSVNGTSTEASASFVGNYGTLNIGYNGAYTYVVDNGNTLVNSLNVGSESLVDSFSYTVYEGGTSHTATLKIDIAGGNNLAEITGDIDRSIDESATVLTGTTTTGTLISTDVDNTNDWTASSGETTYGSYELDSLGDWTYTLENGNTLVDALNIDASLVDTFSVTTVDGTSQTVSVTINGQNDAAIITGDAAGSIAESGTISAGNSITGTLVSTDVDNNSNWTATSGTATYGSYGLDSLGAWTYTLDNGNTLVDALNIGGSLVDTFTVTTVDGTSQTVSVTINGADDASVLSDASTFTGSLTEASGLNNSIHNDLASSQATGQVIYTDVDDTIVWNTSTKQITTSQQGSYSVDADGNWVYNLNNNYGTVQKLHAGQSTTDTFTISATNGLTQTVTVVIQGGEDTPVVINPAALSGSVTEAGGEDPDFDDRRFFGDEESSYIPGIRTVSKDVNFRDPDNTSDVWTPDENYASYGSYSVNTAGKWTYNLDNYSRAVQSLNDGQTLTDTFEIATNDGTSETVTITINGTNDAAYIYHEDYYNYVVEDGGVAHGSAGMPTITGNLENFDVDNTPDSWTVQESVVSIGGYGTYSINASGEWTYSLDNNNPDVEALTGEWWNDSSYLADTFVVQTIDGTSHTVTVSINGRNDDAVITGDINKSIAEASGFDNSVGSSVLTGALAYTDVDNNPADGWQVESDVFTGQYGTYDITSTGEWTYTLNNNNGDVDGLQDGETLTDSFTVYTVAGTSQTVNVTINGANDSAVITGLTTAEFTEDDEVTSTIGNNLNYTDPDNIEDGWQAVDTPALSDGEYGNYTINADGVWSYSLNDAKVQTIGGGETVIDTFTATTTDGTTQTISITINGVNDAAVFSGLLSRTVTESSGVNNNIEGSGFISEFLDITDIDDGQAALNTTGDFVDTTSGYGQYGTIGNDQLGFDAWSYYVNEDNAAVQALNVDQSLTDSFNISSIDGTSQTVTITINGANDAAVLSSDVVSLDEADAALTASGTLTISDVDNSATFEVLTDVAGDNGSFSIDATGAWTYTANSAFDSLNVEDSIADVFTVTAADGTTSSVTVTINGTNDAAILSSDTVTLDETDVALTASGTLTISDVDNSATFEVLTDVAGENGSFSIDATGAWTYTANSAFDSLNVEDSIADVFTVTAADGTTSSVTVTINGTDDATVLGSDTVTLDETDVALTASGTLTISDVDNSATFEVLTDVAGDNGSFSIDATGAWTYTANSAFDSLNVEDSIADVFTVTAADGTTSSVTVTINGTNDPTSITGDTTGIVTEDTSINFFGSLVVTDVDDSGALFTPVTNQNGANNYGKFTISDNGAWQYDLDNDNPLVQHLGAANSLTDTYTFNTITGASQTVSVTINGSIDAGVFITGTADETINGKDGDDYLLGVTGNEVLIGGLGNDVLDGAGDSTGLDTFVGGAGNDVYGVYNSGTIIIENAGEGIDGVWTAVDYILPENVESLYLVGNTNGTGNDGDNIISGYAVGNNVINGGAGLDVLYGGEGSDYLIGGLGSDYLDGGTDDDVLDGAGDSAGLDTFVGGAGNDVYGVYNSGTIIIENAGEGIDGVWTAVDYILPENVESLYLVGDTAGTGNVGDNIISGYALGNNTINGDGGNDILYGGEGNDTIAGGAGTDTISGGTGIDIFSFLFTQSTSTATDHIIDFEIGIDKLDIFTPAGVAANPGSFSRANDSTAIDLSSLALEVYMNADGAGNALAAGGAAIVVSTGTITGTYVVIDDGDAMFNATNDLVINVTGYSNSLPAVGTISSNTFFKVPA